MRKTDQTVEAQEYHKRRITRTVCGTLICLGGVLVIFTRPKAIEAGIVLCITGAGMIDPSSLKHIFKRNGS